MSYCTTLLLCLFCSCLSVLGQGNSVYKVVSSEISFNSTAPQELINARSKQLQGVIDFGKGTFYFKVGMTSFFGFNNSLQQEHFNENYIESHLYPEARFEGKIIENIDLEKKQLIKVRTKGKFTVHGMQKECLIVVILKIKENQIELKSNFELYLPDYNIKIPKVVYNKLASVVNIQVKAQLAPL